MIESWEDLTTADFEGLDPESTLALLPVSAIEQHGPHLPLGTDRLINRGILDAARGQLAPGLRVLTLPDLAVGDSLEHSAFPGTLSLRPELLLEQWTELGRAVARVGLRKLVILNSHGGQVGLVDQAALRLRVEQRMLVVRANYFAFGAPDGLFDRDELADGLHGGELETSMMLHLRPDLVRRQAVRDFAAPTAAPNGLLAPERPVGFAWMTQDLNPAGAVGNAARADAHRGSQLLAYLGECLARLLGETAATPLAMLNDGPAAR
jgi:creatinine amidohydrolase